MASGFRFRVALLQGFLRALLMEKMQQLWPEMCLLDGLSKNLLGLRVNVGLALEHH